VRHSCTVKFAERLYTKHVDLIGTGVTTYSVHPGLVRSELARETGNLWWYKVFVCYWECSRGTVLSVDDGAQTPLYCCLEPSLEHESGLYYR